jgi:outer membrane protein
MMKKVLCISIIALVLSLGSFNYLYAFDIPYISFGEKKASEDSADSASGTNDKIAQTPIIDLSQPLTLKQCLDIATNAPSMKMANISLIQQDINIQDAQANYLPEIDIGGSYLFSKDVKFGWEKNNYASSLSAVYTIWDHGQRKSTLAQAQARKDSQLSSYSRTTQSLIFDVINRYYSLLEAEKLIGIDEQLLDISKQNVEKIKAFIEKGWATEADLATARVQQANNELASINDRNNLDLSRGNLVVVMGLDPDTQIQIIDDPDYEVYIKTKTIETEQVALEDMRAKAMVSRPELSELKASQSILELAAKFAKLERWPQINAETHYNLNAADYLRDRGAIKNYTNWDVMARVTFPLFDGGRSKRTVQKAELALQNINESKTELEQSIALEVRQAYLNFERAKKALDITAVQIEDAKMSLDVAQGRYDTLMDITLLELLDVQTRYARALTDRVQAFYDYKIARRSLEKAMGVLQ